MKNEHLTADELTDKLYAHARRHGNKPSLRWALLKAWVVETGANTWEELLDKEPDEITCIVLGLPRPTKEV